MSRISPWSKACLAGVVWIASIGNAANLSALSIQLPKQGYCTEPEYRQFDFWVGDWDAFEMNGSTPVARVQVDRILDGCVLREDYQDMTGHKGQSFSIYDASRRVWHHSWVTNRGQLLVIEGSLRNGEMVLSGEDHAKPTRTVVRGTWAPLNGGVRETAVTSMDGGRTWKPWFDLMFRPHKP